MFNFFCKILQHPKINPGSAPVNCKYNYTFDKSTDEKIIQSRQQFVHREAIGRVLKHFARIILVLRNDQLGNNSCEPNRCSNGGKCYNQSYSKNFLCHCQGN